VFTYRRGLGEPQIRQEGQCGTNVVYTDRVAKIVSKVFGYRAWVQVDNVQCTYARCIRKSIAGDGGSEGPDAERQWLSHEEETYAHKHHTVYTAIHCFVMGTLLGPRPTKRRCFGEDAAMGCHPEHACVPQNFRRHRHGHRGIPPIELMSLERYNGFKIRRRCLPAVTENRPLNTWATSQRPAPDS